ncbi:hypothetical protein [Streptomyces sp. NPDC059092]|uniref:hypothetical protein n=1 Tax=Streptomyces sp. NPDC059092 TaxID=3346725 RepID=UPI0036B0B21D
MATAVTDGPVGGRTCRAPSRPAARGTAGAALRDEAKIGTIGLGSVSLDALRRADPAGTARVQNPYSLVARDDEDMPALRSAEEIAWVPS